jgi:excisionase family DNA binding protein
MASEPALLSPRQASERIAHAVSADTLRRWAREGRIRSVRLPSGRLLFPADAIDAVVSEPEREPAA